MAIRRAAGVLLVAGLVLAFLPASLPGQPATLLDINPIPSEESEGAGGTILGLDEAGGKVYFIWQRGTVEGELWVTDGSVTGTEIVQDPCTFHCSELPSLIGKLGPAMLFSSGGELWRTDGTRPGTFALLSRDLAASDFFQADADHAVFGGALYFTVCGVEGQRLDCDLWRTDGTVAGTQPFHESPDDFAWLRVADQQLYFLESSDQGGKLWVSDGTAAGTRHLRTFTGPFPPPLAPTTAGRRLFFIATDSGEELWTSDGTAAGTRPVTSFAPHHPFAQSIWLEPAGQRVYFVVDDGVSGREIWRSDGTPAGTVRVTDLAASSPFRDHTADFFSVIGNIVVFTAVAPESGQTSLWSSTGAPSSTAPLKLGCPTCQIDLDTHLVSSGGRVFFVALRNSRPVLWITDGNAAGTRRVRELCTQHCDVSRLEPWDGGVLFATSIFGEGGQIWTSDGTTAGTSPITALPDGTDPDWHDFEVVATGGNLYFFAFEEDSEHGLWVRDAAGATRLLAGQDSGGPSSLPDDLVELDGRLLFTAWDGVDFSVPSGLWSSAGTPETTGRLSLPPLDWEGAKRFVKVGDLLYFQVGGFFEPHDLWRTDGTPQGTVEVAHLQGEAVAVPFQGSLYYFDGGWIWRTDGTVAGTVKTGELPPSLVEVELGVAGPNGIYLKGVTAPFATELWFTDGTTAGTRQFTSFDLGGVAGVDPEFTPLGSHVYFAWGGLWRTDGTPEGTTQIPIEGLESLEETLHPVAHEGSVYFFTGTNSSEQPLRLWRHDGSSTVELGRFRNSFESAPPVPFGGKLYFAANDRVHGSELWSTDGTPGGTTLFRDLFPGWRSSWPSSLKVAGGRLFFAAGEDAHGVELWQSDGTPGGTRLVQDIAPQALSSRPGDLTVAGSNLFFTADDGIRGREPWVLALDGTGACQPSSTRLCLGGGRYAIEATWEDFSGNTGVGHAGPLTSDTGYFWFFDSSNVEVILKVLDGRGVNEHVWVFYGALSNVEYTLTVTDTETGLTRRYRNPSGQLASVGDTRAFGPLGASLQARVGEVTSAPSPAAVVERSASLPSAACAASPTRLCLGGGRFAVEAAWKDFSGNTGDGQAVGLTVDTGWFWFFGPSNVELVLKVLDGRPVNGHHWVFYGALSSVEYMITVTDTQTGAVSTYTNPSGRLGSVADTEAF